MNCTSSLPLPTGATIFHTCKTGLPPKSVYFFKGTSCGNKPNYISKSQVNSPGTNEYLTYHYCYFSFADIEVRHIINIHSFQRPSASTMGANKENSRKAT